MSSEVHEASYVELSMAINMYGNIPYFTQQLHVESAKSSGSYISMVEGEWRSAADALAYDSALLQSVFTRVRRRNAKAGHLELEYFSKQEIIDELQVHEGRKLLLCRPNLRRLHTRLASLTSAQECLSLDAFRVMRVRDKSLCATEAQSLLRELYRSDIQAEEARRKAIPYRPMWSARDPKMKLRSPATVYNVRAHINITTNKSLGHIQTPSRVNSHRKEASA